MTLDAVPPKEGAPVKYPASMLRVIAPAVAATVLAGVNTRTGSTSEPTPLEPRVIEVKAAIAPACDSVTHAKAIRT